MKAKLKELRDKSDENLQREVIEKRKHLFDLRSQAVTEKLEDPTQIGKTKRELARLHTIIKERQSAASKKYGKTTNGKKLCKKNTQKRQ